MHATSPARSGTDLRTVLAVGSALVASGLAWVALSRLRPLDFGYAGGIAVWTLAMTAMMLPSLTPALVSFQRASPGWHSIPFVAGYLVVWGAIGAGVLLLVPLRHAIPLPPEWWLAAALAGAGVYELTRWKAACLSRCRSPVHFLMEHWRSGPAGAFALGGHHGLYCVGCCAGLMVALVALGMMDLAWMILVSAVVFAQKLAPRGDLVARVAGIALIALAALLAAGLVPWLLAPAGGM